MNWQKAHRNRRRLLARKVVELPSRWFMRNPEVTWQEWLDKMLPTIFSTPFIKDSVMTRILANKPAPTLRTQLPFPRLPPFRGMRYRAGAHRHQSRFFMIVDDVDFSKPCELKPRKRFIYGDNWNAYQVIGE